MARGKGALPVLLPPDTKSLTVLDMNGNAGEMETEPPTQQVRRDVDLVGRMTAANGSYTSCLRFGSCQPSIWPVGQSTWEPHRRISSALKDVAILPELMEIFINEVKPLGLEVWTKTKILDFVTESFTYPRSAVHVTGLSDQEVSRPIDLAPEAMNFVNKSIWSICRRAKVRL